MQQLTQLKITPLGGTGLEITRVGFGAWAIGGGGWEGGWGPQEDQQSIAAIHRALELGVNWIDTAAAYGFGHSEEVVGRALAGLDERPYVFTKASLARGPGGRILHNLKRDSVLREAEASLSRLGVDAIDLYQIHWPNPDADIEEGWSALAELKDQGLVRHIGVSNFDVDQLRRIQAIAPVETLQPPYSLIARGVEGEILPFAREGGHRCHRLLADGFRPADRRDDAGADREPARRRLAQTRPALRRAAAVAPPGPGRAAADGRRPARHHTGRGRGGLGSAQSSRRRGDHRLPATRPGRRHTRRRPPRTHRRRPRRHRKHQPNSDDTMTTIGVVMASEESLLPLAEVTDRLRIRGQHYVGIKTIPVGRIIGSVDRTVDFDRLFRPRRMLLRRRLQALRDAFPDGMVPAIAAYEVGGMYFVVDGHHRVALAHQLQMDYIEAEVTSITTSYALTPDVDVRQLIHTEQHRIFKERSRLLVRHPEAKILFSRPSGYGQILDLVEAHAYQMSVRADDLVPLEAATADWYETEYLPPSPPCTRLSYRRPTNSRRKATSTCG